MVRSKAPAADATLAILRYLSAQQRPVSAAAICRSIGLPRSSAYQLLALMVQHGFLMHLKEQRRYALGFAAFEIGAAFSYQLPLARLGRPIVARMVGRVGHSAHVSVLHGRDALYIVEERAPRQPPLVTDIGVRLPAHLTASGRAILAALPAAQVRALYPDRTAFSTRHGTGPNGPAALRRMLEEVRRRGYGFVDDDVTPGVSSVASPVHDPTGHPIASIAITYVRPSSTGEEPDQPDRQRELLALETTKTAQELEKRLLGGLYTER